ncbi:hypothetical protein NUU61_001070 [Penicillium alfredii]|uniref:FAD-binding PCMH-type domain-containing protein n=1 Tax=Penicillium alfredii TaxID=1506179 RepID=A0A9W9GAY0_9EURO|nr:uncharacterized protein NUU61_001070 [Penicillium alfredii]KAJ5115311.1 hypothetical protein NUU61_001070 [Penicillium alfredii]
MRDIKVDDDFLPTGAPKHKVEGHAVTIAAGVDLSELYAAVAQHKRVLLRALLTWLARLGKGLASDNALEFEVVTTNGTLTAANAYHNTDLFWALRGGGGGTFGVVVSVTVRTFPEVPVVVANLNITTGLGLPALNEAGGSGYYFGMPILPLNATASVSSIISLLVFPNVTDKAVIDKLYAPLHSKLRQIPGAAVQYTFIPFPTVNSTFSTMLLISFKAGEGFTGHVVAGCAVATNADNIDSAVNPAWRKTATHMLFGRSWNDNSTLAQQKALIRNTTDAEVPILRSVEGKDHMGGAITTPVCIASSKSGIPRDSSFHAKAWAARTGSMSASV